MDPEMNTDWRLETKYIVAVGMVIFALFVFYLMRPVLSLLVLASLIAIIANPVIQFQTTRLKIPRSAAVVITYLLASILILAIPFVLLPQIVNAVNFLINLDYAKIINDIRLWAQSALIQLRNNDLRILGVTIVMDQIVDPVLGAIQNATPINPPQTPSLATLFSAFSQAFTKSLGLVLGVAGSVAAGVASFILMILASIYISQDAHKIRDLIVDNLPPAYQPEIDSLLYRLSNTWNNFLQGQLALMLIIGVIVWLGATILGLPGAFALGILSGFLELLPTIGPILAIIPAIILALTQGSSNFALSNWVFTLIVIGFYVAVQQLENVFIVPRLMSRAVKLHPLVVILGVFVGALSFGILGAILATPVIASAKEIIIYLYLKIRGLPVEVDLPVEPSLFGSIRTLYMPVPLREGEQEEEEEALAEERPPETGEGESFELDE